MDVMNTVVELINTIGFPIAMVIYFIWDKNKTTDKMLENQNKTTQILAETLNSNTQSIVRNTTILEKLLIKLGAEDITE